MIVHADMCAHANLQNSALIGIHLLIEIKHKVQLHFDFLRAVFPSIVTFYAPFI